MRLIDADELPRHGQRGGLVHWKDIENAPTVDAVPVVRCKDCKYYLNSNEKCAMLDTRLHFYETDKVWSSDCFCSWAERKEI